MSPMTATVLKIYNFKKLKSCTYNLSYLVYIISPTPNSQLSQPFSPETGMEAKAEM